MIGRKITEIGSGLYRTLFFPFKRMAVELKTDSILKQGSYLHGGTTLAGRNYVGKKTVLKNVRLGFGSYVSNGGDLTNVRIGKYTAIGPGVKTILGRHPTKSLAALHPAFYSKEAAQGFTYVLENAETFFEEQTWLDREAGIQVIIGNDVWIGEDVRILEGVVIGDGAVIGAGAIVTKDVEPYSIYAGIPAKKLKDRFGDGIKEKLLSLKWWERDEQWLKEHIHDFRDVEKLISTMEN